MIAVQQFSNKNNIWQRIIFFSIPTNADYNQN